MNRESETSFFASVFLIAFLRGILTGIYEILLGSLAKKGENSLAKQKV
jgi:hypothetical protein